jgi:threonine dehydrogenase-like Zn-dependent dehydrogenase
MIGVKGGAHRSEGDWGVAYHVDWTRVALQRLWPSQAVSGGRSLLRPVLLTEDPRTAAERHWLPVRPVMSGVCGSDWGLILGKSSPYLAPATSFPAVLGHEVVAELTIDGPWPRGTRVVVDPSLHCASFGLPPCRACRHGVPDNCERHLDAHLGPGLLMGYHHRLPGGWSTRLYAPPDQLHPVPPGMDLRRAVLTEPAAIVLNGLHRIRWDPVDTALIIGSGPIGLLAAWLIAEVHAAVRLHVQPRYRAQADLAAALGDAVVLASREVEHLEALGPRRPGMWGAPPFLAWGFDLVVDAVGTKESLQEAVSVVRPGGQVLLIGGAGTHRMDFTPLWTRNATVYGTFGYGDDPADRFRRALGLRAEPKRPVERVVGEVAPLSDYRQALTAFWPRRRDRIKLAWAADA